MSQAAPTKMQNHEIFKMDRYTPETPTLLYGLRQANLCLRAFRHDKF